MDRLVGWIRRWGNGRSRRRATWPHSVCTPASHRKQLIITHPVLQVVRGGALAGAADEDAVVGAQAREDEAWGCNGGDSHGQSIARGRSVHSAVSATSHHRPHVPVLGLMSSTFCTCASSISTLGSFFSVAITTPFVAACR